MTENTYRPRISRERRDTVIEAGEQLNGGSVTFHEALGLLSRYLDVLNGDVTCPTCGAADVESKRHGRWYCWRCDEDRGVGSFKVWAYIEPDDTEEASLPGLPSDVQHRFECDCGDDDSGTNSSDSSHTVQNQGAVGRNNGSKPWENGF